ncbi:MAG: hypothetical protein ACM31C_10320, partial [Acidobacteriota bacterium]
RYSRAQRLARAVRRHRGASIAGAAVAIALVAAAVAVTRAQRGHPWLPVVHPLDAVEEDSSGASFSPDGRQLVFDSTRAPGHQQVFVGPLDGPARQISHAEQFAAYPRFHGDDHILYTTHRGLVEQSLTTGTIRPLFDGFANYGDDCAGRVVAWHEIPNERFGATELAMVDDSGVRSLLRIPPRKDVYWLRCDRAGKRVVYSLADRMLLGPTAEIWMLDLATGATKLVTTGERRGPTFDPDGKTIVFSAARGGPINLWEIPIDGGVAQQLTFGAGPDMAPDISRDGSRLVFSVDNTSVPIVEYSLDHPPRRLTPEIDRVRWIAVSDDGELLVSQVERHRTEQIVVRSLRTGEERVLGTGMTPAFDPGGHTVVWTADDRLVTAPAAGGAPRTLARLPGAARTVAIGPDHVAHTMVFPDSGAGIEAWSVAWDGTARREASAPYAVLIPAPAGGWIAAQRTDGVELVPPGDVLGAPGHRMVRDFGGWDRDGRSFVALEADGVVRYQVATGEPQRLMDVEQGAQTVTVAPDGRTFYVARVIGQVTRHVITNFGDRPRPR